VQPFLDDDTRPIRIPVNVQAVRTCRPALTRVSGPNVGERLPLPTDRKAGIVVGRAETAGILVEDPAVSREHCRLAPGPNGAFVLTDLASTNGTIVNGERIESIELAEGDKIQVGTSTVFRFSLNDKLDEGYLDFLYETSIRDSLTGLLNRRYLLECLERDLGLARRHSIPMSVILIDCDHFKAINDSFGHKGGDEALKQLAKLLMGMQRKESLLARYGGEEFAVFLRNVEPAGVQVFADRMRHAVQEHRFTISGGPVRLTVSAGVAGTTSDGVEEPESLLERADRYLYLSKSRGRNCVTSARTFAV
jgi:two-component system cell cycle response regulator